MTYNILAQKYAQGGWHSYCSPQHLQWDSRRERLLDEIEAFSSDIICLQEVEAPVFADELQPWLAARGYQGHYLARQYGDNVQGPPEGVALFYRTDMFELQQHYAFTYSAVPTVPPAPPSLSTSSLSSLSDVEGEDLGTAAAAVAAAASQRSAESSLEQSTDDEATELDAAAVPSSSSSASMATVAAAAPVRSVKKRRRGDRGGGGGSSSESGWWEQGEGRSGSNGQAGGSGRHRSEFWPTFCKRKEGAILALLRHRPSSRSVLAAVTHLFWNPAFPDVKAFQAAVLCREMASFLRRHARVPVSRVPVLLAGDFNSLSRKCVPDYFDPKLPGGPDGLVSGVYTLLTRGSLHPDHPDHPATRRRPGEAANPDFRSVTLSNAGLSLASAYQLAYGRDPPLTTRTPSFAGCVDYIFVSPHWEVGRTLELPYAAELPPESAVRDPLTEVPFPPIPNEDYPSDHLSLAALLRLRD